MANRLDLRSALSYSAAGLNPICLHKIIFVSRTLRVKLLYVCLQGFIDELFQCLFALPSPVKRYLPKCKSQASRSGAYDLLVEIVKGNLENYKILHEKMLHQHSKGSNNLEYVKK